MTVVDLWVNALSPKAAKAFLGQTGNESVTEMLGSDLEASKTIDRKSVV